MLGSTISAVAVLAMGIALAVPAGVAVAQDRAPDDDYWWPDRLNLDPLRQTSPESKRPYRPRGADAARVGRMVAVIPGAGMRPAETRPAETRPETSS